MAVGFTGVETVDAATIDFGYKGGADTSFLKLADDVICAVVAKPMVDFGGTCVAVGSSRHTKPQAILFGDTDNLIKVDKL